MAGEPWLAGMPASVKFEDLRRDPPFALHSGSAEPDAFSADAKLSGRATQVTADERARSRRTPGWPVEDMDFELFRVDLEQVVLVALNDEKTALVISSWRLGRGSPRHPAEPRVVPRGTRPGGRRWTEASRGMTLEPPDLERPRCPTRTCVRPTPTGPP